MEYSIYIKLGKEISTRLFVTIFILLFNRTDHFVDSLSTSFGKVSCWRRANLSWSLPECCNNIYFLELLWFDCYKLPFLYPQTWRHIIDNCPLWAFLVGFWMVCWRLMVWLYHGLGSYNAQNLYSQYSTINLIQLSIKAQFVRWKKNWQIMTGGTKIKYIY